MTILNFTGDIAPAGRTTELFEKGINPFQALEWFFHEGISFANLECPLSERGTPNLTKISIRGTPATAKILKQTGFDFLSIANNHMFDFGIEAFEDTKQILSNNNLRFNCYCVHNFSNHFPPTPSWARRKDRLTIKIRLLADLLTFNQESPPKNTCNHRSMQDR